MLNNITSREPHGQEQEGKTTTGATLSPSFKFLFTQESKHPSDRLLNSTHVFEQHQMV